MSETETGIEVVNRRRLAFAPQRVFDAFADPLKLARWWGPNGFSNRIDAFDFVPGGAFRLTMTSESGNSFDNVKLFKEIEAPHRIVMHHLQPMHDFTHAMMFGAADGATDLTWHLVFAPGHGSEELKVFIAAANEQNFDRLETFLKDQTQ